MAFDLDNIKMQNTLLMDIDVVGRYGEVTREPNFEIGPWGLPVTSFLYRFQLLKRNSPQYTDEEASAVVYFGMIAQQPTPTADYADISIDWQTVDAVNYGSEFYSLVQATGEINQNLANVEFETFIRLKNLIKKNGNPYFGIKKNDSGKWQIYYAGKNVRVTRSIQDSYIESVYHLNKFLYFNGMYSGIQKTLAEESRKLQGLRAQALASQAAAAKALALSKTSEDVSEETIQRYKRQLEEAQAQEQEFTDYLNKINNTPTGTGSLAMGSSGIIPLAIGAAAAIFALR